MQFFHGARGQGALGPGQAGISSEAMGRPSGTYKTRGRRTQDSPVLPWALGPRDAQAA